MTHRRLKILLIASLVPICVATCGGSKIKVYNVDPELGLERTQNEELIPFEKIPPCVELPDGKKQCHFAALSWTDLRTIVGGKTILQWVKDLKTMADPAQPAEIEPFYDDDDFTPCDEQPMIHDLLFRPCNPEKVVISGIHKIEHYDEGSTVRLSPDGALEFDVGSEFVPLQ